MKRQLSFFTRTFNRLDTQTARMRSKATVPMATPTVRYDDVKGMSTESHPVGTKESSTVVTMCSARKMIATIEADRCSSFTSKRPTNVPPTRFATNVPRATTSVKRMSATKPVARVVYQR